MSSVQPSFDAPQILTALLNGAPEASEALTTLRPDVLARTAPAVGGRRLPLHTPVQRAIGILHRQDRFQSPALRRFRDLARSHEGA